ncbi:MAG: hypothetical protein ACOX28_00780 [Bacilli bacterium]
MAKKKKRVRTPAEAHNRFLGLYKKTGLFLFWSAILNLVGNSLYVLSDNPSFALGYRFNELLFSYFLSDFGLNIGIRLAVIFISLATSALFTFLSFWSVKRARLWSLITGAVIYLIDTVLAFIPFKGVTLTMENYIMSIVIHLIIMIATLIALFAYANIITLAKQNSDLFNRNEEE